MKRLRYFRIFLRTFSNAFACLVAAEAGLGIAFLPDFVAEASLSAGRVRPIPDGRIAVPPWPDSVTFVQLMPR